MVTYPERSADPEVLVEIRARGGAWWGYENQDLGHPELGRLVFLQVGPGCTFTHAPARLPDSSEVGIGWRYVRVGLLSLESGQVQRELREEAS